MRALVFNDEAIKNVFVSYAKSCEYKTTERYLTIDHLRVILNDSLFLSQQIIEGRPVHAKLIIDPRICDLRDSESRCGYEILWIGDDVIDGLEYSYLRKYLDIVSGPADYILLSPVEDKKQLKFLGLLFMGTLSYGLERRQFRFYEDKYQDVMTTTLICRIKDGSVTLSLGEDTFVEIKNGIVYFSEPLDLTPILEVSSRFNEKCEKLILRLNRELKNWESIGRGKFRPLSHKDFSSVVSVFLNEIIREISSAKHGGTLIFGKVSDINDGVRFQPGGIKVDIRLGGLIRRYIELFRVEWLRCEGSDDELQQEIDEEVATERIQALKRSIIGLSKTDGAVIFDSDFNVIGAGVFLKPRTSAGVLGGARKKFAESFVRDNPNTAAVVISQDGQISLF